MISLRQCLSRLHNAGTRAARNDVGGTVVEMALSSLILFATFFAVFEVTMACYTYNAVSQAARETASWGVFRGSKCSTYTPGQSHCGASQTDLQNYAISSTPLNWSQCTTANPCLTASWMKASTVTDSTTHLTSTSWATCTGGCSPDPGNLLLVTINYPYALTFPVVKTFNINLTSTSQVVVSQ
jgi:Flp pilus assembly protein TadG